MAKITELDPPPAPISGDELVAIVQNDAMWVMPVGPLVGAMAKPFVDAAEDAAELAASYATDGGALLPAVWTRLPAFYGLRLRGSGTVTIETKDANGVISTYPKTFTPTGPSLVRYPYFGAGAVYARATLTGTASAEVF